MTSRTWVHFLATLTPQQASWKSAPMGASSMNHVCKLNNTWFWHLRPTTLSRLWVYRKASNTATNDCEPSYSSFWFWCHTRCGKTSKHLYKLRWRGRLRFSVADPAASTGHCALTERKPKKKKEYGCQNRRLLNRAKTQSHLTVPRQKQLKTHALGEGRGGQVNVMAWTSESHLQRPFTRQKSIRDMTMVWTDFEHVPLEQKFWFR